MSEYLKISEEIRALGAEAEREIRPYFSRIEEICDRNTEKVLAAFAKNRVSDNLFAGTTGYGYDDYGRDTLDKMYADIFGTIPVAEALLAKGAQLGTVLSFMMAVTTLSLPSLILLRKVVKPKLLALFVGICVAGIVVVGYLFNALQFVLL